MKNIFFLNNAILILLSLSSCTQESFTGNKLPLQATDVIRYRSTSSQKSQSGSNKADNYLCQVCFEFHPGPRLDSTLIDFYTPPFVERIQHVINRRDPLGEKMDINVILGDVSDEIHSSLLLSLFSFNFGRYDTLDKKEQDNIWANFLKIIGIEKELPKTASKLIQVAKALEQEEESQKINEKSYSGYTIYLYYYLTRRFKALEKKINTYFNISIEELKGDEEFLRFLEDSNKLIEDFFEINEKYNLRLIKTKQEKDYLLALQKDMELFKKFFETVKFRKDLY